MLNNVKMNFQNVRDHILTAVRWLHKGNAVLKTSIPVCVGILRKLPVMKPAVVLTVSNVEFFICIKCVVEERRISHGNFLNFSLNIPL